MRNVVVKESDDVLFWHAILDKELIRVADVGLVPVVAVCVASGDQDGLVFGHGG